MITRRRTLFVLGLSAVLPSAYAAPPTGKVLRLGLLEAFREKFDPDSTPLHRALVESLREQGYVLGRDFTLEYRSAQGNPGAAALPGLAAELVRLKVDVFVTIFNGPTQAASEATKSIPIVAIGVSDPVIVGMAASLARPGGNVTGLAINATEISAKRVQFLKEAIPNLSRVAVLWNSNLKVMERQFQKVETAAPSLGVTVLSLRVSSSDDFDKAFAAISQSRSGGLIVLFGPMRGNDLPRIVEFVSRNRIPTIFELGQGVSGGGLMDFGPDPVGLARHAGAYVDKIANGAKAADLPIQEPTTFELVINLKAAHSMGLSIPESLRLRATRVIE